MPAIPIRWTSRRGPSALINFLQQQPDWKNTAVIIAWDDSDGWYDHAFAKTTNPSSDAEADQLDGPGKCGTGTPLPASHGKPVNGRCGPGTRMPFLVISPWAKLNYVGHTQISQASVVRFIEDNWLHGQRLGGGSFDATAGSIMDLFDFTGSAHERGALSRSGDRHAGRSAAACVSAALKRTRDRAEHLRRTWRSGGAGLRRVAWPAPLAPRRRPIAAGADRCPARTPIRSISCVRPWRRCRPWRSWAG